MDSQLLVTIVYDCILYGSLVCVAIPVMFFFLWTAFEFWKKHIFLFYLFVFMLFGGAFATFYFSKHYWVYWYYAFPSWVQIIGLLLIVSTILVVEFAELSISAYVRFFYPLLKGQHFSLKTKGIYQFVRHPMYAVFPWFVLGAFLYTGQWILLPVFLFVLVTRTWYAKKEEAHLKRVVIGDYDKYMQQTPNRFYPKIF